jgi:hypothetical protein
MAKHWPFEAGMVSERAGKHVMRGTRVQPSKMASFDDKAKVDARLPSRGVTAANKRSIDENQREGSVIAKGIKGGGAVRGSKRSPTKDWINQDQKPNWPGAGSTMKKRKWQSHRKAPIMQTGKKGVDGWYGGKNGRP